MAKNILLRKGKRLLSVVLAVAVAGAYMPAGFGAKKAYAHESGVHDGYIGLTEENAKNYQTSESSNNGLKEGKYYLTENINENEAGYEQCFYAVGDVTICMNGKQLSLEDDSKHTVLSTSSNNTKHLIIENCAETKSSLIAKKGTGISATWDLKTEGEGVELNCDISITARTGIDLSGNSRFRLGGDIDFNGTTQDFKINNYKGNESITPIELTKRQRNTKQYSINFYNTANIDSATGPVKFTKNWSKYMGAEKVTDYYKLSNGLSYVDKYQIVYYDGEAAITLKDKAEQYPDHNTDHIHNWEYKVSEDKSSISAYCKETDGADKCEYQGEDKAVKLTLDASDMTYTGEAYNGLDVKDNLTNETGADLDIKYAGREGTSYAETTEAPVSAGKYTAKVTVGGCTITKDFEIKKADITTTVSLGNWVYGETAKTPVVNVNGKEYSGEVSYQYKKKDADDEYKDISDFSTLKVGKYTLKATVAATENTNAGEAECDFEVSKNSVNVEVSIGNWIYSETAKEPIVSIKSGANDITASYKDDITYTYYTDEECTQKTGKSEGAVSEGAVPKNAGTYYVKADVAEKADYAGASAKAQFTIEEKEIGIKWSGEKFTYNGKEQAPTAEATGLASGDKCNITITGGQTDSNVKTTEPVYVYAATATGVDNPNYKLPETGLTQEFTINPAKVSVVWSDTSLTYNGEAQKPKAELEGVIGSDNCNVTVSGEKTDSNEKTGETKYTATAEIDNKNYDIADGSEVSFTIAPKEISDAKITLTPGDVLHSGSEVTQSISSVEVDGKKLIAYDDYEIDTDSVLSATGFGKYIIKISGKGNYTGTASVSWKIKDENEPTGEISISENKWDSFLDDITFGIFFNAKQTVKISAEDIGSGVDKIYYYNSDSKMSKDQVAALDDSKWTEIANGGSYDIDDEADYVVYAKITDMSGNVSYISSNGFALDKTAPKIEGVENGKTYCEDKEITITDSNLDADKVMVNGEKITLTNGKYTLAKSEDEKNAKTYTISAEDKAGNKKEITVKINKSHTKVIDKEVAATCTKEGLTEGSHCSVCGEVIDAQTEISALGHDMPDEWTVETAATATKEGLQSKTCKREGCGHKIYQSIPMVGTTDNSSLDKYAEVAPDALVEKALFANSKDDIVSTDSKIFREADKADIAAGRKDAKVWIEISKTDETSIAEEDKAEISAKAAQNLGAGARVEYFDADLFSQVGTSTKSKISEPGIEITVRIQIPNSLLNHNSSMIRQYKIIRLHKNGSTSQIDVLGGDFNSETNEFTFKTDKFSTYAIGYNDRRAGGSTNPGGGSSGNVIKPQPTASVQPSETPGASPETSIQPTTAPTADTTVEPTVAPTAEPTLEPTTEPTTVPTTKPTAKPTKKPAVKDQSGLSADKVSKLKLPILLASGKGGDKKVKVSWASYKEADGYDCFWSYCNGKKNFTKFATVKGAKNYAVHNKLKNNTEYKYFVAAYKKINGKKVYIARSNHLHVAMKADKKTNVKTLSVNKTKVTLKKGQTFKVKGSVELENTAKKQLLHAEEYRYYTSDKSIAKVSKKGKIKAVKKGKCTVYVLANNGIYKKIKVTVK